MKTMLMSVVVVAWIGWSAAPRLFGAEQEWTGIISDSQCGANHGGEVEERPCTLECVKNGFQYVIVVNGDVKNIANQDFAALPQNAGLTVTVRGELKGDAIVISTVDMPKSK